MLYPWLMSLIFWIIIIKFPEIIAYMIWWLFVIIWITTLLAHFAMKKNQKQNKKSEWEYFTFWGYKIYKNNNKK